MTSSPSTIIPLLLSGIVYFNPVNADMFDSFRGELTGIHPLQNDRFIFSTSAYFPATDTDIVFGGGDGSALDIDLEDRLGFDEQNILPMVQFTWRMTDHWRLSADYFSLSEEGQKVLLATIDTGDGTFLTGGAGVVSEMDLDILRVLFGYSFLREEQYELGAGLGAHVGQIDASVTGLAAISGGSPGCPLPGPCVAQSTANIDEWAPLPNIALFGNYAITDQWLLDGRIDWFAASFGDYKGNLWNVSASINWHPFEHVGFFFMYKFLQLDIKKDKNNMLDWKVDMDFHGPALGINVSF
jgi:hypothetical protein